MQFGWETIEQSNYIRLSRQTRCSKPYYVVFTRSSVDSNDWRYTLATRRETLKTARKLFEKMH